MSWTFAAPIYEQYRYLHPICSCVTRSLQVSNPGAARILLQSLIESLGMQKTDREKDREELQTLRQRERDRVHRDNLIRQREGDRYTKKIRNAQGHREGKR